MKRSLLPQLAALGLLAAGVFLGRNAHADTTLDFNSLPAGQSNNQTIIQTFGDFSTASSSGITVAGAGTPNIGLTWQSTGGRWDYYIGGVWAAGQLDQSAPGTTHEIVFTPPAGVAVALKSLKFHPYYSSSERYTYEVSAVNGLNTLTNLSTSFLSDSTKNHPVILNVTGAVGQSLILRIRRLASTLGGGEIEGSTQNIAVDDVVFAQVGSSAPNTNSLVGHWVFASTNMNGATVNDLTGNLNGTVIGAITMGSNPECLVLDGVVNYVQLSAAMDTSQLPRTNLTTESWVALRSVGSYPGIFGCLQDNGSFEHGWWVGANAGAFNFALAADATLTYLASPALQLNKWYLLVTTYDGTTMRMYVNGALAASSTAETGLVNYTTAPYVIGAYKDDNEFYGMDGYLREVKLHSRTLSASEVLASYDAQKDLFPATPTPPVGKPTPALGPSVRFTGISNAVVAWQTASNQPSIVEFGETNLPLTRIEDTTPKTNHSIALNGLKPRTTYHYVVKQPVDGQEATSETYTFETDFNYSPVPVPAEASPFTDDGQSAFLGNVAQAILDQTGVTRGYALDYGAADGRLAYELAKRSDLNVLIVSTNPAVVAAARQNLQAAGIYGSRVTALQSSLSQLPYTRHWFNLIVSSSVLLTPAVPGSATEMFRVLRPSGGVAFLGLPTGVAGTLPQWSALDAWARAAIALTNATITSATNRSTVITRSPLFGAGEWTHIFGNAGQNCSSGDQRVLGRNMKVQWFGNPGPRGFTDRQARNPTPLLANGVFFSQGNNRLTAQDAYNGRIYWSMEVPDLRRVNMPRDGGNWCADDASLYVAHRDRLWRIASAGGTLTQSYNVQGNPSLYDWGYVGTMGDRVYGTSARKGGFYTRWDGSWEFWYDSTTALNEIAMICGENLFSLAKSNGAPVWTYTNGLVINSTIVLGGGRIYFVDSRNPAAMNYGNSRLDTTALWSSNNLVCLDALTGAPLWQQPLAAATSPYPIVFYLSYANEKLVLNSSTTQYNVYCYSATNGALSWSKTHAWNRNHHGGHMYHPVIVSNLVIVEPFAYDLNTGVIAKSGLPERGGCHTMSASANTVHYINWDYSIGSPFFWDLDTDVRRQMAGTRASCWLSVVSGGGMISIPASSAGCACRFPLQGTITFTAP